MKINKKHFKQLINNIIMSGMYGKYDIEIIRRIKLLNIIVFTGIIVMIPLGIVAFIQGNSLLGIFDLSIAIILFFNSLFIIISKKYNFASYLGISFVGIFFFYLVSTGGPNNTGHFWFYTFPLFSVFLLGSKKGAIATLLLLIPTILLFIVDYDSPYLTFYSFDFKIRFITSFLVIFTLSYFFENIREKTQHKLTLKNLDLNKTIKELQETDSKLQNIQEELEIRVKERTKELIMANIHLKSEIKMHKFTEQERKRLEAQLIQAKKMEAIGTLAGGVAHDLNNILAGLVSYPDLLLMEIPKDSPLREPILIIQKSGKKAAVIVQDLLTLARRGLSITKVVNLNDIITEYLKSPEYKKLKSYNLNLHIKTSLATDLLNIEGSPVHLSKTVMNLVSNASEAMPKGGNLYISTENRYIDRTIKGYSDIAEGDYAIMTVADTGIGMSEEDISKIFEPFYTKKVLGRSGTGLGMAVVWGTVKDHNGYIDVQSSEGKGTTFKLYFPITRNESIDKQDLLSIEDCMGHGEAILIIDDVEEQKNVASAMLKKLGYNVSSVSSGEEAVEYMKHHSVDLLVLDMIMDPGIDGLETYRKIISLHPGQKAIIVSGYSESEHVKEAQRLGARAYVQKPYLLEKIALAVRIELNKS